MSTTATTLNVMVVASPEQTAAYSALALYLDMPNETGAAANTQLAGGDDKSSQLRSRLTLDMPDKGKIVNMSLYGGAVATYIW